MDILAKFAERLNELIYEEKLTARQLAEKLKIPEATVSYWVNGKQMVSLKYALVLADFFKCSLDYLIGRSDDASNSASHPLIPFNIRLRQVLSENGESRYSLNKNTKFKDGYFSNWDKGAMPQMLTLVELADILDCSVDYLVGRYK